MKYFKKFGITLLFILLGILFIIRKKDQRYIDEKITMDNPPLNWEADKYINHYKNSADAGTLSYIQGIYQRLLLENRYEEAIPYLIRAKDLNDPEAREILEKHNHGN